MGELNWTHKNIRIKDIRKLYRLYALLLDDASIPTPVYINDKTFEDRLKSYFLKDSSMVDRDEIMKLKWNFYVTKGYYIKMNEKGVVSKFEQEDNEKFYVSFLDIDGPLSTFKTNLKQSNYEIK